MAVLGHPGGAVRLFQISPRRQRGTAIKDANIVQAQETAFKDVLTISILTVHPPGEVQHQLRKDALKKLQVTLAPEILLHEIEYYGGPGMDRRIRVAKAPLISGNLRAGGHGEHFQHPGELLFG